MNTLIFEIIYGFILGMNLYFASCGYIINIIVAACMLLQATLHIRGKT